MKFSSTPSHILTLTEVKVKKLRYQNMKDKHKILKFSSRLIKHHLLYFSHLFCVQYSTGHDIIKYVYIFELKMRC